MKPRKQRNKRKTHPDKENANNTKQQIKKNSKHSTKTIHAKKENTNTKKAQQHQQSKQLNTHTNTTK